MLSLFQALTDRDDDDDDNDEEVEELNVDGIQTEPVCEVDTTEPPAATAVTTTTTSASTTRHWKEAHLAYCQQHGLLRASLWQVWEADSPTDTSWELPARSTVCSSLDEFCADYAAANNNQTNGQPEAHNNKNNNNNKKNNNTASSKVRKLWNWGSRKLHQYILDDNDEEDAADNHDISSSHHALDAAAAAADSSSVVDLHLVIIHVSRTRRAVAEIQEAAVAMTSANSPQMIAASEWTMWCRQLPSHTLVSTLTTTELEWLLQVLQALQLAQIVKRAAPKETVVILRQDVATPELPEQQQQQVNIAMWDLLRAQTRLEVTVEDWRRRQADCTKRAIQCKRQQQPKLALAQLQIRKLLQERIEQTARTLVTLEHTRSAMQSAHSNQSLAKLLGESSDLLSKLIKEGPSLEAIDELQMDLQEGVMQVNQITEALGNSTGEQYDEDALLQELQELSLGTEEQDGFLPPPPSAAPCEQVLPTLPPAPETESSPILLPS